MDALSRAANRWIKVERIDWRPFACFIPTSHISNEIPHTHHLYIQKDPCRYLYHLFLRFRYRGISSMIVGKSRRSQVIDQRQFDRLLYSVWVPTTGRWTFSRGADWRWQSRDHTRATLLGPRDPSLPLLLSYPFRMHVGEGSVPIQALLISRAFWALPSPFLGVNETFVTCQKWR